MQPAGVLYGAVVFLLRLFFGVAETLVGVAQGRPCVCVGMFMTQRPGASARQAPAHNPWIGSATVNAILHPPSPNAVHPFP